MKSVIKLNVARIGYLSVVTLMALSLSMKSVIAADDFKLWQISPTGQAGELLKHVSDDEKKETVELLTKATTGASSEDKAKAFSDYAKKFSNEPFKFVEGLKEAWSKLDTEAKKTAFKDSLKAHFEVFSDPNSFGSRTRQQAFSDLINKLFEMGFSGEDLLKKLFTDKDIMRLWSILGITTKPEASATPTPSATPAPSATPTPVVGERDESILEPLFGLVENLCRRNDNVRSPEANDQVKALQDQLKALKDGMNELIAQQAQQPQFNPNQVAQKKAEKGIEDILPGLLANALKEDKDDAVTPAQQQQPVQASRNNDRDDDQNSLNNPLPEPQPSQQPQPFIPQINNASNGNVLPPTLDLPDSGTGRSALRDAQDVAFENEMRQPVEATLSPNAGIPELVMAKAKLKTGIQRTSVALNDIKDKADRLEENLEELKDGARAALPSSVKRKQAQMEADLQAKKSELSQLQQMASMAQGENQQAAAGLFQAKQQEVAQLEQAKNQYAAQVEITIEEGNSKIKSLKKRLDNMNSAAKKLEGQLSAMKGDEASISQLINMNLQMQQQQPAGPTVQNVNNGSRVQGMAPRSTSPSRLTPSMTPTSAAAGGTSYRGPLGKTR